MNKLAVLFAAAMFQTAALAARQIPALSRLRALSGVEIPDIRPASPAVPQAARAGNTQLILNTQTGQTCAVVPAGGGFVYAATGQFVPAVYNGSGYILQNGQYMPVVGGGGVKNGVKPAAEGPWAGIVEKAVTFGLVVEPDGVIPAGRYLADLAGPQNGPHKADYFSVWGYTYPDGSFSPDSVTMVSENWEIAADGNWRIDQWLHWLGLDGVPQRASRTVLIEDPYGRVLDAQSEAPQVGDPRAEENRGALIEKWRLYAPPGK